MGAETGGASQASLGEPLTKTIAVSAAEGFRLWAADYDEAPNALLSLEMGLLSERIAVTPGICVLDAGSGTGRWMAWARSRGAQVFGIDRCREMVQRAAGKTGLDGCSAIADISAIPFADGAMDLALCSFTLGYVASPGAVLRELARVSRDVIVSDLHPDALRAGWTRSFRRGDRRYELANFAHSVQDLDRCASDAGLKRIWRIEASFGETERELFELAGKGEAFDSACRIPAVLTTLWRKQSD